MLAANRNRHALELVADLEAVRQRCERLSDALAVGAALFAVIATLAAATGWGTGRPVLAAFAGLALAAAACLALGSHAAAKASRAAPRVVPTPRPAASWRRAA